MFIHSCVDRNLGYFQFWAIMNNADMNNHMQVFVHIYICISSGSGIDELHGSFMFGFVKTFQTVRQSGCIILHSQQWYVRVPISPHLCQHYCLSDL